VIRTAARRVFILIVLLGLAVAGCSAVAVLAGASLQRAVALGLYAVGSFTAVIGFALGIRNPFRSAAQPSSRGSAPSGVWEATEFSAVLIVIGLVLLAVGIAVDARVRLI
jgi:uncharacterized membrane protein YbhN (UPF0104 family)